MSIGPSLALRQSQSLVMTPQLRQAIKLLQFNNVEVAAFVDEELERNPLLERDERGSPDAAVAEAPALDQRVPATAETLPDAAEVAASDVLTADTPLDAEHAEPYDPGGASDGGGTGAGGLPEDDRGADAIAGRATTLREHLAEQVRLNSRDRIERAIGLHLIDLLEPSGRLSADLGQVAAALGVPMDQLEGVRARLMRFDPCGMFARDLRECLAAQLAERNRLDPAMATLLDHLDLLAARDMRRLTALCGVDAADLADMAAEILRLDPKPGADFDAATPMTIVPDVLMRRLPGGDYMLELNAETLPRLLVNHGFSARVLRAASREERTFLVDKLQTANWLIKSLQQRAQTILRVAAEIVRQQDGFFAHGTGHLRPLILRDVADAVELHESTVSRVTSNKYIATPRGLFELKYFFTTAIAATEGGESHSAETVRWRIRALVAAEHEAAVLSDDAIVSVLRREGVDIARRTVAKYREALHIPGSVQRKRERALSG